MLREAISKMFQ